ncbi:MAG TPA: hypothetical protein VHF67_12540 [Gaiellaceae bacterium]|jgi:hypothetical protein|nr:hypothetical protein [Gaiellaceae bacterium]
MGVHGPGRAWQTYDVTTRGDGSASVRIRTASTLGGDDAVRREEQTLEFETVEEALRRTGKSRITAAGVVVTVTIDGKEYVA